MRRLLAVVVAVVVFLDATSLLAVDGKKAQYVGGTLSGVKEKAEGTFLTNNDGAIRFDAKKNGTAEIPYAMIEGLEYGQNAGRRVAVAIFVSPLALFSKKRKHFLTVNFKDADGKDQAAVFELGKDLVRTTLTILEARTGKQIEYQDEEARKSGLGGK